MTQRRTLKVVSELLVAMLAGFSNLGQANGFSIRISKKCEERNEDQNQDDIKHLLK